MILNRLYIGQVAKMLGVSPNTIRWYESEKLINPSKRNSSNYRYYTKENLETLIFIRKSLSFGFSINEIKTIFQIKANGEEPCDLVFTLLDKKIHNLQLQIDSLLKIKHDLENLQNKLNDQTTQEKQTNAIFCGCIEHNKDLNLKVSEE